MTLVEVLKIWNHGEGKATEIYKGKTPEDTANLTPGDESTPHVTFFVHKTSVCFEQTINTDPSSPPPPDSFGSLCKDLLISGTVWPVLALSAPLFRHLFPLPSWSPSEVLIHVCCWGSPLLFHARSSLLSQSLPTPCTGLGSYWGWKRTIWRYFCQQTRRKHFHNQGGVAKFQFSYLLSKRSISKNVRDKKTSISWDKSWNLLPTRGWSERDSTILLDRHRR